MKTVDEIMALVKDISRIAHSVGRSHGNNNYAMSSTARVLNIEREIESALKEREVEPFAWYDTENGVVVDVEWNKLKPTYEGDWKPLYTAPPKAQQPINQKLLTALSNLLGQVEKFTVENGEADFETAEALSVINEVAANDSAGPKAQPMSREKEIAICEGHFNQDSDEYFNARPQLDNAENRRIFYAGHRKGWLAGLDQKIGD